MDEIDFGLCMMLMVNSRVAYRELAEIFNMSVNSIHKRIKTLVDLEVVQNFNTKLSLLNFSNPVNVIMFGNSRIENREGLLEKLGNHECIFNVTRASSDFFYIHAYLRDFSELDPLVSFIRQTGAINEIEIGLDSDSPTPNAPQTLTATQNLRTDNLKQLDEIKLTKLDYLIVNSLKNNSRKPVSEIAVEVGVSAKTVRRRLNRMIEEKLIDFSIEWYPDKASIILSIIILKLDPNAEVDKSVIVEKMREEYGQTILFSWNLSNLPNLMLLCAWTPSMKQLQTLEASLLSKDFNSLNATILIEGKMFPTWRDTYLEQKIKEIKDSSV